MGSGRLVSIWIHPTHHEGRFLDIMITVMATQDCLWIFNVCIKKVTFIRNVNSNVFNWQTGALLVEPGQTLLLLETCILRHHCANKWGDSTFHTVPSVPHTLKLSWIDCWIDCKQYLDIGIHRRWMIGVKTPAAIYFYYNWLDSVIVGWGYATASLSSVGIYPLSRTPHSSDQHVPNTTTV